MDGLKCVKLAFSWNSDV